MFSNKEEKWVIIGTMLALFIASLDNTIVATAMGRIVADLGGMDQLTLITGAYMAASVPSMLVFGRLADMYGRKKFFILPLGIFLIGSLLCGTAETMLQLGLYRALQGVGGGAIMPIVLTVVFDILPPEKRGKISALFGMVFGLSSVLGPLLGGWLAESLSWRWAFYINMPIGLLSLWLIKKYYHESTNYVADKVDWLGAFLLVVVLSSFMLMSELGGKVIAWSSQGMYVLLAIFGLSLAMLTYTEYKAEKPIIAVELFKNRLFAASQGISFLHGVSLIAVIVFVPLFAQAVYGGSAVDAGNVMGPMMIAVVIGSQISGRLALKTTYRAMLSISLVFMLVGTVLLCQLSADTTKFLLTLFVSLYGLGMGMSFPVLTMSSVHNLDFWQRGAANSMVVFFRAMGMTIGITVFGLLQNFFFENTLKRAPDINYKSMNDISGIMQPELRESFQPEVLQLLLSELTHSITDVYMVAVVITILSALCIALTGEARLGKVDAANE